MRAHGERLRPADVVAAPESGVLAAVGINKLDRFDTLGDQSGDCDVVLRRLRGDRGLDFVITFQRRTGGGRRDVARGLGAEDVMLVAYEHARLGHRGFEMVGAVLQFAPERDVGIEPVLGEVLGRHAKRIGLHLHAMLPTRERLAHDRVNLGNLDVGHRETAGRRADAMHHDVAAAAPVGPVVGVGKADIERKVIVGIRVHLLAGDRVEPLGHLTIALAHFRAELTRPAAHREGLQQCIASVRLLLPDFEFGFLLIGANQHRSGGGRPQRVHLGESVLRNRRQRSSRSDSIVELIVAASQQRRRAYRQTYANNPRAPIGQHLEPFQAPSAG